MDIGKRKHPLTRRDTLKLTRLFSGQALSAKSTDQPSKKDLKQTRQETISDWIKQDPRKYLLDSDSIRHEKYIFTAESLWRIGWDALILIFLVFQSFYIPFLIGFYVPMRGWLVYLDFVINLGFMIDIIVSFNTAFYIRGNLVLNRREIAKKYFKSWFLVDLISTFPYEWLVSGSVLEDEENIDMYEHRINKIPLLLRLIKIYRVFRMMKLLRLTKLKVIIIRIEDILSHETLSNLFIYARLTGVIFFLAHWTACTWHFTSMQTMSSVSRSWVLELETHNEYVNSITERYITSLYWAFTTMITIGYGDIVALSAEEQLTAMLSMWIASGFFSFIVGNFSSIISSQSAIDEKQSEILVSVNSYMKKIQLPTPIQYKVRGYLKYIFKHQHKRDLREQQIFELLNEPLREEILLCTHGTKLLEYEIFPRNFSAGVLAQLTKILKMSTFGPNDGVIEEGEIERVLYFIIYGRVTVYHSSSSTSFKSLKKNKRFGEIGFFSGFPRTASVTSVDFTELFYLDWKDLMSEFEKAPDAKISAETIEKKCKIGDYSDLDIKCFLCKKKGHIVRECNNMFQNLFKKDATTKWVGSRNIVSRRVNPHEIFTPNYIRRQHNVKLQMKRHISPGKKSFEISPESKSLFHKAQKFSEKTPNTISEFSFSSRISSSVSPEHKLPRVNLTSIYQESESDEETLINKTSMKFEYWLNPHSIEPTSPELSLQKSRSPIHDEPNILEQSSIQNSEENMLSNELQYSQDSSEQESFDFTDPEESAEYSMQAKGNLLRNK
jgi:hypothetical protein